ncbi:MAG: PilC/PilY family type IV pilus protein [Thiobacillus sp.]|nr:PilC/PilY family type IV pilus protein [Thiobacillus sp.]
MLRNLVKMVLAATLVTMHAVAQAEDIDLFAGAPSAGANVLIMLDNTANWSAQNQQWPGGITQGQAELEALKTVINSLAPTGQDSAIKVGLMMLTDAGAGGGYVRSAMKPMTAANRAAFAALMDTIYANFSTPSEKVPASLDYDRAMFEVFKYFGGYTSPANSTTNTAGEPVNSTHFGALRYATVDPKTDPTAFVDPITKLTYKPASESADDCPPKNFLVFIGNGFPDIESSGLGTTLLSNVGGNTTQIYNESPLQKNRPTDEWARFLFQTDVSAMAGKQNVITYTINVCKDQCSDEQGRLLTSMANVGGGSAFLATSAAAIQAALAQIFSEIQSVNSAFASASLPVSVNAQGTYLNQVFIGMFRPEDSPRWYGNMKQYQFRADAVNGAVVGLRLVDKTNNYNVINPINGFVSPCAQSFWSTADTYWPSGYLGNCLDPLIGTEVRSNSPDGEIVEKGSAAQRLRAVLVPAAGTDSRNVQTCDASCAALANFNTGNSAITKSLLGDAAMTDAARTSLINWARGQNVDDELSKGPLVMRPSVHGDVVHSRPLAIDYGSSTGVVVFYGGNDGMLRAIKGGKTGSTDGDELWSFVAPEHYGKFKRLRSNSPNISFPPPPTGTTPKDYFFDGPIGFYNNGSNKWIYPTMRRGGSAVYAFDVSTPTAPTLKWKRDATQLANIGQTWSEPKVVKVAGYGSGASPVIIMGGGYDTCEDQDLAVNTACSVIAAPGPKGNRVFVLDANNGTLLATLATDKSVAADVTVVDSDNDGLVDVAYAADTGGNLYRINIGTAVPGSWTINKLAALGCTLGSCGRKFLHAPEVVTGTDFNAILVGSGNRERPLLTNHATEVDNAFFMIKDDHSVATSIEISTSALVLIEPDAALTTEQQAALALPTNKGWYLRFGIDEHDKEQVVTSAVVFAGVVYFSTHQPVTPTACGANLGTARGYAVNYLDASTPGGLEKFSVFAGGGLPPSPVTGVVTVSLTNSDNTTATNPDGTDVVTNVPFIIGGGAPPPGPPGCGISGLSPCLVTVEPTPVRSRVFWYIQQ